MGSAGSSALVRTAAGIPVRHFDLVLMVDLPPALILFCAAVPAAVAQHKDIILLVACRLTTKLSISTQFLLHQTPASPPEQLPDAGHEFVPVHLA